MISVKREIRWNLFKCNLAANAHICTHGSFVLFTADILNFVLKSLHGDAAFIAAIKTAEKKIFIPERI